MPSKRCNKCAETKPLEAFARDNRSKGTGRQVTCRACARVYRRAHYEANRERLLAKARDYRDANPEKRKELRLAWYRANRDKALAYRRAYSEANPEYVRKFSAKRRARKRAVPTEDVDTAFILYRDAGICGICEHPVDPEDWHLDHVIPLSKGGHHTYANVQVAHPDCNMSKGTRVLNA